MKRILLLLLLTIFLSLDGISQRIKGSDTVLPLAQKQAENYIKKNPKNQVTITGGGSGVGFSALFEGTTDIAMTSRKIKFREKIKFGKAKKAPVEKIIAYDALAVIVHPDNKISQLTRKQVEDIFTGRITNWKQLGGADMKIVAYSRETSSGTYEFFKEHLLEHKNYKNSVLSMPATGAIIQSVNQTKGAIGYVGLAYLNSQIKALKISYDGKNYISPTMQNAKNKSYPVIRALYFYYDEKNEKKVNPFINYILSPTGQKTVESMGYVPL